MTYPDISRILYMYLCHPPTNITPARQEAGWKSTVPFEKKKGKKLWVPVNLGNGLSHVVLIKL